MRCGQLLQSRDFMLSARPAFAILGIVLLAVAASARPVAPEVRALWVVRTALVSPAAITSMVTSARAAGFNALLVQVRGRGDAYYASRVELRASALAAQAASFDPLALVLRQGHAAGLKVHAWVNVNLVADAGDVPTNGRHVVNRHPEWLMVPADLATSIGDPRGPAFVSTLASWTRSQADSVEGLYTSPIPGHAGDYVVNVVRDLVSRYQVDGVHFDYVRYPGPAFDCSREALREFKSEVSRALPRQERRILDRTERSNALVWIQRYPARWEDFRRLRLTSLMHRLRAVVKEKRPRALVSAAVVPDPATAVTRRFQDWPGWMRKGLLDVLCPMAYATDDAVFRQQVELARTVARGRPVWAGIGAYRLTGDQTLKQIQEARGLGVDGVILFSYDSLVNPSRGPDNLARIGAQAFGQ
jgi:uncharacterized lipoprotein YddW (UPF0748 family)